MSVNVLGSKSFNIVPDVNGLPLMLNGGNTPSISSGTFAARPSFGTVGRLYVTTDTNLIYRDTGVAWVLLSPVAPNVLLQSISGNIPAISGTTLIALANTTPLITAGTQIWQQNVTPTTITSKICINFAVCANSGTSNRVISTAIFRGATCIGVQSASIATIARPQALTIMVDDIPGTLSEQTYSARVGISSSATWYINSGKTAIFNGMLANNGYTIMEFA